MKETAVHKKFFRAARRLILRRIAHLGQNQSLWNDLNRILIIAPHPDDEVFGCGGLVSRLIGDGKSIDVLFLSNGAASHNGCCAITEKDVGTMRRRLAVSSNEILHVTPGHLHFLEEKDGKLPQKGQQGFTSLSINISKLLKIIKPEAVFCPHPFEGWADHIAAAELTCAAITILPAPPHLYYYCVWFWFSMPLKKAFSIDWRKARLLDISEQVPLKQKAMNIYINALAPCGNPWIGRLPSEFLRTFDWNKELFFEANLPVLSKSD